MPRTNIDFPALPPQVPPKRHVRWRRAYRQLCRTGAREDLAFWEATNGVSDRSAEAILGPKPKGHLFPHLTDKELKAAQVSNHGMQEHARAPDRARMNGRSLPGGCRPGGAGSIPCTTTKASGGSPHVAW